MKYSDERFAKLGAHPGGNESTLRLIELAGFTGGDRVLDLCCGWGDALHLMGLMGIDAIGVDEDEAQIEACEKRGVKAIHADAVSLPFDDASFDGAIIECSVSMLMYEEKWDAARRELLRVLKKGARLAISDFTYAAAGEGFMLVRAEDAGDDVRRYVSEWLWEYGEYPPLCGAERATGYRRAVYKKA